MRIVSLVPSVTETLSAWGIEPIGVTRFCERPDLMALGGTKDPDVAAIVALSPDLVVLCEEENRVEDADQMARAGLQLEVQRIDSVEDVEVELARLAARVGHEGALVDGRLPSPAQPSGVTVVVPIWRRPWVTLGRSCYGTSVLRRLGFEVLVAGDDRYPEATLEALVALRPTRLLAPNEPYPFAARHSAELEQIAPVTFVDGADLFWWGWRTPAAIERLGVALAT